MNVPSRDTVSDVTEILFPALDGAVTSVSLRLDAKGANMDLVAASIISWALARHAAIHAVESQGNARKSASIIDLIKEMIDKQYQVEFDAAAAKHAARGRAGATVQ